MRTFYNKLATEERIGQEVTLCGWVNSRRDHGGVIFVDLRDRTALVQIVFDSGENACVHKIAENLRDEYCLQIKGIVRARGKGLENPKLITGKIEVVAHEVVIFSKSQPLPFVLNDEKVGEETRLNYRYLDLRSFDKFNTLKLRSKVNFKAREVLNGLGFLDVETPMLTKSTPEGARDYLVPSRVHNGEFFALPQSPQLFKQLLMVAGFEKYYQIVKCFRDEDLRAERQPEFTQIDIEQSFCTQEDVLKTSETLVKAIFEEVGIEVKFSIARMTYDEAMEKYGCDKPDLRFDMSMIDVIDLFKDSSNEIFANIAKDPKNKRIKALKVQGGDEIFSRKDLKIFENFVRGFGASGLGYFQMKKDGLKGPLLKFMSEKSVNELVQRCGLEVGDLIFFGAGEKSLIWDYMGRLRAEVAKSQNLIDKSKYNFVWVIDFPMFEEKDGRYHALHHPFTLPINIDEHPLEMKSTAYDLVLNGFEIAGGSLRIYDLQMQKKVFDILGIDEEEANKKFKFLLDALKFGAPPHGGIAFGLDRIIMVIANKENIRDVIAFPKTQKAQCLMTQAPSNIDRTQLKDLGLKINSKEKM